MGAGTSRVGRDDAGIRVISSPSSSTPSTSISVPPAKEARSYERLPPVQSRETVRYQATTYKRWRLVHGTDTLYESHPHGQKVFPPTITPAQTPKPHKTSPDDPVSCKKQPPNNLHTLSAKRPTSASPEPRKKQRLLVSEKAVEIASQSNDRQVTTIANGPQVGSLGQGRLPLFQDKSSSPEEHDEGDVSGSYTLSPQHDETDLTQEEKDEQLVKHLAALQRKNISLSKPGPSFPRSSLFGGEELTRDFADARQSMLRDQEAGGARSRKIRREKEERRRLQESAHTSPTTDNQPEPESLPPVVSSVHEPPRPDSTSGDSGRPSMSNEKLLDIAQGYCSQGSRPSSPKLTNNSMYV
jgi:hypothetical protein